MLTSGLISCFGIHIGVWHILEELGGLVFWGKEWQFCGGKHNESEVEDLGSLRACHVLPPCPDHTREQWH